MRPHTFDLHADYLPRQPGESQKQFAARQQYWNWADLGVHAFGVDLETPPERAPNHCCRAKDVVFAFNQRSRDMWNNYSATNQEDFSVEKARLFMELELALLHLLEPDFPTDFEHDHRGRVVGFADGSAAVFYWVDNDFLAGQVLNPLKNDR